MIDAARSFVARHQSSVTCRPLSCSRSFINRLRPCAGERQDRFQPGMVAVEHEFPPVQASNRRRKAQPESGAGFATALLEPHETLYRARTVAFGYARAMIGDSK